MTWSVGSELAFAPGLQGNAARYEWELDGGYTAHVQVRSSIRRIQPFGHHRDQQGRVDGYTMGLRTGLTSDSWSVECSSTM
jgi:hypothetical protein